ncbi:MAG: hypothetical protein OXU61_03385 [Gammaproteobacteria bacterium]|nr:hypothetical protein [Gammaproteobacteria bacterium]
MKLTKPITTKMQAVSGEILDSLKVIADAARKKAGATPRVGPDSFANAQVPENAVSNLADIHHNTSNAYYKLLEEPAIARVVAEQCDTERRTVYYICRTIPITVNGLSFGSYRSPVGRLASLEVGDEYTLNLPAGGHDVRIVESAKFTPSRKELWDAINAWLASEGFEGCAVPSLRELYDSGRAQPEDAPDELPSVLEEQLREERAERIIQAKLRRNIIHKMDLRDQPILDKHQDDIFRLPLNCRLFIRGAPGTGKTTTLIRRLGQKRDRRFLNQDELDAVGTEAKEEVISHAQSWVMFTPTELLKLYIKEAFNREQIPAPDKNISTWADYRNDLARSKFGVLRSAAKKSGLVMKHDAATLATGVEGRQIEWFSDFDQWQNSLFWNNMRKAASDLIVDAEKAPTHVKAIKKLGNDIKNVMGEFDSIPSPGIFDALAGLADNADKFYRQMKVDSDRIIDKTLNRQVNQNRAFLDELASFITNLAEPEDEPDDDELDDDLEITPSRVGRLAAATVYRNTVRTHSRAKARGRSLRDSTRIGKIVKWLDGRALNEEDMKTVGRSLLVQSGLRRFSTPVRRYIDRIPTRYRAFRRIRQQEGKWYRPDGFSVTDAHPLEVDIILLAMIQCTHDALKNSPRLRREQNLTLERLQKLNRNQVLVDEATDFSPIQLKCMFLIANPDTQSFFACGDFNQRITDWGVNSDSQMQWAVPGIETKDAAIVYRQSDKLLGFAGELIKLSDADAPMVSLPAHVDNRGFEPVLAEHMTDKSAITAWLTERIEEIERHVDLCLPLLCWLMAKMKCVPLQANSKQR